MPRDLGGLKGQSESDLDAHIRKRPDGDLQRRREIRQMSGHERLGATEEQEQHAEGNPNPPLLASNFLQPQPPRHP